MKKPWLWWEAWLLDPFNTNNNVSIYFPSRVARVAEYGTTLIPMADDGLGVLELGFGCGVSGNKVNK